MTARMSLEEARRLGLIPKGDDEPAPARRKPQSGTALPKRIAAMLGGVRRAHKGGRHKVNGETAAPFAEVRFVIQGDPRTKHRARTHLSKRDILAAFSRAKGRLEVFAKLLDEIKYSSHTPEETKAHEQHIAMMAGAAMRGRTPALIPLHVEITFRLDGETDVWPTDVTDPDLDNAVKAVLDGCNKIVWKDDRLVCSMSVEKRCSRSPSTTVVVRQATQASFGDNAD